MSAPDQVPVEGFDPVSAAHHRTGAVGPQPQDEYDEIFAVAADIDTGDVSA